MESFALVGKDIEGAVLSTARWLNAKVVEKVDDSTESLILNANREIMTKEDLITRYNDILKYENKLQKIQGIIELINDYSQGNQLESASSYSMKQSPYEQYYKDKAWEKENLAGIISRFDKLLELTSELVEKYKQKVKNYKKEEKALLPPNDLELDL